MLGLGRLEDTPADFELRGLNVTTPQVWEDGQRLEEFTPGSFEWWYMDGHFSNGLLAVATFITGVGLNGELFGQLNFNIADDEGVIVDQHVSFAPEDVTIGKDVANAVMGSSFFRSINGLNAYEIYVDPA